MAKPLQGGDAKLKGLIKVSQLQREGFSSTVRVAVCVSRKMTLSDSVAKTVASGVAPLELQYTAVRSCTSHGETIGFLAEAVVNSVELGVLRQSDFAPVCESGDDVNGIGIRFAERLIQKALAHRSLLARSLGEIRHPVFVAVRCPVCYAMQPQLYQKLKALLQAAGCKKGDPVGLCLAFDQGLLKADCAEALRDIATAGVQTMLICGADDGCMLFRLAQVSADWLLLPPQTTQLLQDRSKPGVSAATVQFVHSANAKAIAAAVQNDEQLRQLARIECDGALLAGEVPVTL